LAKNDFLDLSFSSTPVKKERGRMEFSFANNRSQDRDRMGGGRRKDRTKNIIIG